MFTSQGVFQECGQLEKIELPANVTTVGYGTFCLCNNLVSITLRSNTVLKYENWFESAYSLQEIYVPAELLDNYKSADGWKNYADKIQAVED